MSSTHESVDRYSAAVRTELLSMSAVSHRPVHAPVAGLWQVRPYPDRPTHAGRYWFRAESNDQNLWMALGG
ncbi:MAG: hypothetical protein ACRCYU_22795 [Nocardioides sp.]